MNNLLSYLSDIGDVLIFFGVWFILGALYMVVSEGVIKQKNKWAKALIIIVSIIVTCGISKYVYRHDIFIKDWFIFLFIKSIIPFAFKLTVVLLVLSPLGLLIVYILEKIFGNTGIVISFVLFAILLIYYEIILYILDLIKPVLNVELFFRMFDYYYLQLWDLLFH